MVLDQKQKYEIIVRYEDGMTIRDIANKMNVNKNTVNKWILKYKRDNNVNRKKKSENINITDKKTRQFEYLANEITKNRKITIRELENIIKNDDQQENITKSTICNRLKKYGVKFKYPKMKPILKEKHKEDRLNFAKKFLDYNWEHVIFSDESTIWLDNKKHKIWIKKDEDITIQVKKHTLKRNIWGFIIKNNKLKTHIFSCIMDAHVYVNIINDYLPDIYNKEDMNIYPIFQQDNDPKHTSKLAKNNFAILNIPLLDWPSCSPDLNPIEHIWKLLKQKVNKRIPTNAEKLELYIKEESEKIEIDMINILIDSMKDRLVEVIKNNGGHTSY